MCSCVRVCVPTYRSNLDLILNDLGDIGYSTEAHVLTSSDHGLPQRRKRYYILAILQSPELAVEAPVVLRRAADCLRLFRMPSKPAVLPSSLLMLCVSMSSLCQVDFLLPADSFPDELMKRMQTRQNEELKQPSLGDKQPKWKALHMAAAESRWCLSPLLRACS